MVLALAAFSVLAALAAEVVVVVGDAAAADVVDDAVDKDIYLKIVSLLSRDLFSLDI